MGKMTKETIDEIKRLHFRENMTVNEIAEKLKDRGANPPNVAYYCKQEKKGREKPRKVAKAAKPAKQKAAPRMVAGGDDSAAKLHALIDLLVEEVNAYVRQQFLRARKQIVLHVAETRKKRIAAGEKLPPIDLDIDD